MMFGYQLRGGWKTSLWAFWGLNVASFFMIGSIVGREFNQRAGQEVVSNEFKIAADTISVKMAGDPYEDVIFNLGDVSVVDDLLVSQNVHVYLRQSENDQFQLIQKNYSRGKNFEEANQLAMNITDKVEIKESNVIEIPSNILVPKGEKWRNQRVDVILKVPEGKFVDINRNLKHHYTHLSVDRKFDHPHWVEGRIWLSGSRSSCLVIPST